MLSRLVPVSWETRCISPVSVVDRKNCCASHVDSRIGKAGGLYTELCCSINCISMECTAAIPVRSHWLKIWNSSKLKLQIPYFSWCSLTSLNRGRQLDVCGWRPSPVCHWRRRAFTYDGEASLATGKLQWWGFTCYGEASLAMGMLHWWGFTCDGEASLATRRLHWWGFTCDGGTSLATGRLHWWGFICDGESYLTADFRLKFGIWLLDFW